MAGALMLLPIMMAACGEDIAPPPPTGSIAGQVMIESQGADGVSVTLSSGATATTAGGGSYRFDNIEPGTYTISIAGFPAEASFDATSMSVTVGTTGGTATANFSGTYIRTASVRGSVTVEGNGLAGVTVSLSGMADNQDHHQRHRRIQLHRTPCRALLGPDLGLRCRRSRVLQRLEHRRSRRGRHQGRQL